MQMIREQEKNELRISQNIKHNREQAKSMGHLKESENYDIGKQPQSRKGTLISSIFEHANEQSNRESICKSYIVNPEQ